MQKNLNMVRYSIIDIIYKENIICVNHPSRKCGGFPPIIDERILFMKIFSGMMTSIKEQSSRITTAILVILATFISIPVILISFHICDKYFSTSDTQTSNESQYAMEYQQTTDNEASNIEKDTGSMSMADFDPTKVTDVSALFANCSDLELDLAEHEAVFVEPVIVEHSFAESVMSYSFVAILAALCGILSVIGVTNIPQIWQQFKTKRNIQRMTKEKERKMREALQKELEAKKDGYVVYMSYLTTECRNIEQWAEHIQDGEIKMAISQICDSLQFIIEHTDRDEYKTANFAKLQTYYIPEFKNLLQDYYKCENSMKFGYMHSDTKARLKKIILKAADIFKITAQESIAKEISEMDSSAMTFECQAMQDGLMQDALQAKLHPLV